MNTKHAILWGFVALTTAAITLSALQQPRETTASAISKVEEAAGLRLPILFVRTVTNQFSGTRYVVFVPNGDLGAIQIDTLTTNSNGYTIVSNTLMPTVK